jgi:hypothetical protein
MSTPSVVAIVRILMVISRQFLVAADVATTRRRHLDDRVSLGARKGDVAWPAPLPF